MLLAGFKRDYMESMEVEVSVYSIEYTVYEKQNFESKKITWPKHALLSLEKTKEPLYDNYNNRLGLGRNMA